MTIQTLRPADISEVAKKIQDQWENDLPDLILEVLRQHEGKPLGKRVLTSLEKAPGGPWYIMTVAGMTHLQNAAYRNHANPNYKNAVSILMYYHSSGSKNIDCNWIQEHNTHLFSARKERNAKRLETLNDPTLLQSMANALFDYQQAKERFTLAQKELATLTGYGEPFSPDCSLWSNIGEGKETL